MHHGKTKHFAKKKLQFVQELVEKQKFELYFLTRQNMLAYIPNKSLRIKNSKFKHIFLVTPGSKLEKTGFSMTSKFESHRAHALTWS